MAKQGANWDTIRDLSRDLATEVKAWMEDVDDTRVEGNGFAVVFDDGSEATFTPTITKDATGLER